MAWCHQCQSGVGRMLHPVSNVDPSFVNRYRDRGEVGNFKRSTTGRKPRILHPGRSSFSVENPERDAERTREARRNEYLGREAFDTSRKRQMSRNLASEHLFSARVWVNEGCSHFGAGRRSTQSSEEGDRKAIRGGDAILENGRSGKKIWIKRRWRIGGLGLVRQCNLRRAVCHSGATRTGRDDQLPVR